MKKPFLDPNIEKKYVDAARKDKEKFAPLYKYYKGSINKFFSYRVSDTNAAEDLTSKVFEKALKGIDNFQWQGVPFSAWLFRIARNTLIDFYRKAEKEKKEVTIDHTIDITSDEKTPHQQLETMLTEDLLYKVLKELPSRERQIIYLKFYDGYTNRVIAKITGLSETNVGTILYRTLRKMRKTYTEFENKPTN